MFNGFKKEALEFLSGIRANNNKAWFEEHKEIYLKEVYEPMCELAAELYEPYKGIDDMMFKAGRIYKDPFLSPDIRYRDTMWIYVRHEAYWWNKTPTFFFELSPEGAVFGFRLQKPDASVLELFRTQIGDESDKFLSLIKKAENDPSLEILTDEYKRKKEGSQAFNEEYFNIRSISIHKSITDKRVLFSKKLRDYVLETFDELFEIEEYFQDLVVLDGVLKAKKEISSADPGEGIMPKAPSAEDYMW
ncbi:MAG: DUF2461 family protein [Ruminococcus sp.]|nr:DUF2461 family protein [Ruminococcus sp.]